MTETAAADIPIFILCGGRGTRLGAGSMVGPKPMLEIGDRPLLAHLMHCYARWGFRRFVLCTGYRHEVISNYFLTYHSQIHDFTIDLADQEISYHQRQSPVDWQVTVAHTGLDAMTGARIARAAARFLGSAEHFGVTYGDGLTDADLGAELAFHLAHDDLGTVLAVNPVSQFGMLELDGDGRARFAEKPRLNDSWINGGFFFFRRGFLDYLDTDAACVLEQEPLQRLGDEGGLRLFAHDGFWSAVDTMKDRDRLQALFEDRAAPWLPKDADA